MAVGMFTSSDSVKVRVVLSAIVLELGKLGS